MKICNGTGGWSEPVATKCVEWEGCQYSEYVARYGGDDPSRPTNCFKASDAEIAKGANATTSEMAEGASCAAICPSGYERIGFLGCSHHQMVGDTYCIDTKKNEHLLVLDATAISTVMRMDMDFMGVSEVSESAQSIKSSLYSVLNVDVTKVDVKDPVKGSYLSSTSNKSYALNNDTTALRLRRLSGRRLLDESRRLDFPTSQFGTETLHVHIELASLTSDNKLLPDLLNFIHGVGINHSTQHRDFKRALALGSPPIHLEDTGVIIAPRTFSTKVAKNLITGELMQSDQVAPPVFLVTTTVAPAKEDDEPLILTWWVVLCIVTVTICCLVMCGCFMRLSYFVKDRMNNS